MVSGPLVYSYKGVTRDVLARYEMAGTWSNAVLGARDGREESEGFFEDCGEVFQGASCGDVDLILAFECLPDFGY